MKRLSKEDKKLLHDKYIRKTGFKMEDIKFWVNGGMTGKEIYKIWLQGFRSLDEYSEFMNDAWESGMGISL